MRDSNLYDALPVMRWILEDLAQDPDLFRRRHPQVGCIASDVGDDLISVVRGTQRTDRWRLLDSDIARDLELLATKIEAVFAADLPQGDDVIDVYSPAWSEIRNIAERIRKAARTEEQ